VAIPIIGDIVKAVVDRGGDLISEFITDKDKAAEFKHQLEIAVLNDKQLEREAETRMFEAQQATIQAELHQTDLYTKRTRPVIARRSFNMGLIYVLLTAIPEAGLNFHYFVVMPWVFSWEVVLILYSPALTYMGVRGFEKWKGGGVR